MVDEYLRELCEDAYQTRIHLFAVRGQLGKLSPVQMADSLEMVSERVKQLRKRRQHVRSALHSGEFNDGLSDAMDATMSPGAADLTRFAVKAMLGFVREPWVKALAAQQLAIVDFQTHQAELADSAAIKRQLIAKYDDMRLHELDTLERQIANCERTMLLELPPLRERAPDWVIEIFRHLSDDDSRRAGLALIDSVEILRRAIDWADEDIALPPWRLKEPWAQDRLVKINEMAREFDLAITPIAQLATLSNSSL